jgi:hypothetical protein
MIAGAEAVKVEHAQALKDEAWERTPLGRARRGLINGWLDFRRSRPWKWILPDEFGPQAPIS